MQRHLNIFITGFTIILFGCTTSKNKQESDTKEPKNLQLGEEIDFGINEMRNFVTVDRIEKLANKRFALTISSL